MKIAGRVHLWMGVCVCAVGVGWEVLEVGDESSQQPIFWWHRKGPVFLWENGLFPTSQPWTLV